MRELDRRNALLGRRQRAATGHIRLTVCICALLLFAPSSHAQEAPAAPPQTATAAPPQLAPAAPPQTATAAPAQLAPSAPSVAPAQLAPAAPPAATPPIVPTAAPTSTPAIPAATPSTASEVQNAAAPPVPGQPNATTTAVATPQKPATAPVIDPALAKAVEQRRTVLFRRHVQAGRTELGRNNALTAARELALAYVFDAQISVLFEVGQACRRADLDIEALTILQRLEAMELSAGAHQITRDELTALRFKVEDPEIRQAQNLREHIEQAKQAFQKGRYELAIREYALAHALKPLPRLMFNIAQAYRRANRAEEAYIFYARFLESEPQTPVRAEVQGYLRELRKEAFLPPVYKWAWFWGVLGASAAVVAAGVIGIVVAAQPKVPQSDGGVYVLTFPGL